MNIGISGLIINKTSINFIDKIHKLGEILQFSIVKYDPTKKCYILDFIRKEKTSKSFNNISMNNRYFQDSPGFNKETSTPLIYNEHSLYYSPPIQEYQYLGYQCNSYNISNIQYYNNFKYVLPVQYATGASTGAGGVSQVNVNVSQSLAQAQSQSQAKVQGNGLYSNAHYLMAESIYPKSNSNDKLENSKTPTNSSNTKLNILNSTKFKSSSLSSKVNNLLNQGIRKNWLKFMLKDIKYLLTL